MKNKRFLSFCIAVLALFFVADRVGGMILQEILLKSGIRFSRLYSGKAQADIIVMGDSRGVNSIYAPELDNKTGKKVDNLCYNGMSMPIIAALLEDYVKYNGTPEQLLLEASCIFQNNSLVKNLKLYTPISEGLSKIQQNDFPEQDVACSLFSLYRFNSEYFLRTLYYLKNDDQKWMNRHSLSGPEEFSFPKKYFLEETAEQEKALAQIVEFCNNNNIKLSLFISPYYPGLLSGAEGRDKWLKKLRAISGTTPLMDYSELVNDYRCFSDQMHMNIKGSRILMDKMLADKMIVTAGDK